MKYDVDLPRQARDTQKQHSKWRPLFLAAAYPLETARRHYQLCLLDYGRVVMSCFWKGASAEAFAAKAARQNCSMVYREVDAAMRFVRRMDECVTAFESERERA